MNNEGTNENLEATMKLELPPEKPKKKIGIIVGVILVLIVAVAGVFVYLNRDSLFSKDNEKTETESKRTVVKSEYTITDNGLQNFDLYFMQLENNKKNVVYSPLSIKYALEMLAEGTDGDTKVQLDSIIGDYVAKKYPNNEHMSFANALFIKDEFEKNINNDYKKLLSDKYNAELIVDSFRSPKAINDWVSGKTFKLIPDLLDDVSDNDFVLVNALAIDMEWNKKIQSEHEDYSVSFQHEKIEASKDAEYPHDYDYGFYIGSLDGAGYTELEFSGSSKKAKSVEIGAVANKYDIITTLGEDNIRKTVLEEYEKWKKEYPEEAQWDDFSIDTYMNELKTNYKHMSNSTDFLFNDNEDVKVFAKDLKTYEGVTLQYVGIMPKKVSLDEFIKNTKAEEINGYINGLKNLSLDSFEDGYMTIIDGYIPLFNYEYELDLMKDLESLGITDVFDSSRADLSKMIDSKGEYIDTAVHKANIEFSNEGIKAAAATAMGGKGAADDGFNYWFDVPVKRINMTFNNPYMYLIRDKESGEVWFAGTVYEPKELSEEDYSYAW